MPTLRARPRWLAVAIAVLLAAGALVWTLHRGGDPAAADRPAPTSASGTSPGAASEPAPGAGTDISSPGPTSGAPGEATEDGTGEPDGGRDAESLRGDRRRNGPEGPGGPDRSGVGVPCWGGTGRGPASPVAGDATTTEVRDQVAANLQLLRELSPPPAVQPAVEGLRSYYRRVGEVVAKETGDGRLRPEDRSRIEKLTEDVYADFAPPVVAFLSHRC
ncbi:hypothetical protein [Nocardioides daeguensis]|uniref:Uncharacterized protein n=1 Tax=Nocardioides daeguensis TaxID=908359 RepID=A0ABP6UXD7_9ACTN|nr:hypothetical protein [Nocardioides daeguensis]MBV6726994.1 hypothetical protein [Nocardioides daeguensis]MCR1771603.1 hypothetical protein [Nocardioides daeguensis]